ncbi:exonuclease V subunit alpha [Sphingopyxis sp. H038]|uniref:MobF family relaxase n=1 Tax=unclassified Sphingopyxis TaxID=2614943 RepID=UPI000730C5DE|nr:MULTISPECIES: MobF family relaxase [unclassified Sphingopyxis]KTE03487.1 exonuclease V subunit alpha [Sphingopyxis sp. H012]KTE07992.1 exonuclease V subunit alpha [Sphingopyxis sp. H053]KTE13909.1 exonuclease V subunit alpha [Sphingopyxis sp. H093]KTE29469.1 exonuclease V subunit alpha [Sphingopyxis sp. H080]KTE34221.1 exonuclease V subunit alpha [Sphingopyxis sp. H038]
MVASVSALTSSAQASSYYEADDYYAEGGLSPSEWHGKGAEELGLKGDVDRERFRELLDGKIGDQQLGTFRDGQLEHRPGWDVTLSAPKSVSIMAEVAGDRRLIAAHGEAVKTALAHVETHMAVTRVRHGGAVTREATGNLIIASFQHGTSRAQDPQLHTHNVIMNATQGEDGSWRSLEPRAIYQLQKQIGAIYRQELALKVREFGYEIDTAKESMFEIKGISADVMAAFSTRSAEIEAALGERGTSREAASAAEKQVAALDTRQAKFAADQASLVADWRRTADRAGFSSEARLALISEAKSNAVSASGLAEQAKAAERAVAHAADKLGERQSVFSVAALHEEAGRVGLGRVSYAQIGAAIDAAGARGEFVDRTFLDRRGAEFAGFTTHQNIEAETRLLQIESEGRGALAPIASPLAAAKAVAVASRQAEHDGIAWNADQRSATEQLLTSRNRITAVQGYAGTAKTTTVLATFAREAEARGVSVVALAPTASAAMVLGEALATRGDTVARHMLSPGPSASGPPAAWIVDEASLLSARDTARLFDLAAQHNARVVLVGDVKQLGSVEAGAAFAQLQTAGMETAKLGEIVRQTNTATKEAVLASIEGDAKKALAALDRGGGAIIEGSDRAERFAAIADRYAGLDKANRARTLVIEPSREGRDALTADIRQALARSGALKGPTVVVESLVNKGLTRAEARDPLCYDKGDVVRFDRDYADKGVARGEAFRVEGVDPAKAAVALRSEDGREVDWRLRQWGAGKVQLFETQRLELRVGDSIRFTRNDREAGRVNGARVEVTVVDADSRSATVRGARGQIQTLRLDTARDRHIAHGYVDTAFAAQGRTADHVIVHADSRATNLVDQKSFYVGISRAKQSATIFTNDRAKLVSAINERAGTVQTAIAQAIIPQPVAAKTSASGLAQTLASKFGAGL